MTQLPVKKRSREEWRQIPGAEFVYSVSSFGRVRRDTPTVHGPAGRLLKPQKGEKYLQVRLAVFGAIRSRRIHNLVAAAFIGPRPFGYQVNHIDGDKHNNRADNLEYLTKLENERHAARLGLKAHGDRWYAGKGRTRRAA
jgi:hypothetical protein